MRRSEVKVPVRAFEEPFHDAGRLVGCVVVQHQMHLPARRNLRRHVDLDLLEECEDFLRTVTRVAGSQDLAGPDVQRGEQRGGPMSVVFRRVAFRSAGAHRQDGLGAFQSLDLALSVHTEHQGVYRRAHLKAHNVPWSATSFDSSRLIVQAGCVM